MPGDHGDDADALHGIDPEQPPTAGRNSFTNSIVVKRVWGEYMSPLGVLLRFGRQPNQWGLGMVHNAGDGYDSDWQSTVDRILIATSIKSLDLHIAGMWDFPSEGAIGSRVYEMQGQPYDLRRFVDPSAVFIARKSKDGRELKALERPGLWNGGMARWLTRFVEIPESAFTPVKTVNDLLRPAHQPA